MRVRVGDELLVHVRVISKEETTEGVSYYAVPISYEYEPFFNRIKIADADISENLTDYKLCAIKK